VIGHPANYNTRVLMCKADGVINGKYSDPHIISQYPDFESKKLLRIFDLCKGIYGRCLDDWLTVALF